jgi:hypothetical protein
MAGDPKFLSDARYHRANEPGMRTRLRAQLGFGHFPYCPFLCEALPSRFLAANPGLRCGRIASGD